MMTLEKKKENAMAPDSQKSLPSKKPKKKCKPPRDGRNFKGNGLAIF